jgi:hypothetical protein
MMYLDAWEIMSRHSLVPRRTSKCILKAIIEDKEPPPEVIDGKVTLKVISHLRTMYREKVAEMGGGPGPDQPRNLPFYHILRDMVPGFLWTVAETGYDRDRFEVRFTSPYVEKVRPSLVSLLLELAGGGTDSRLHVVYSCIYRLSPEIAKQLERLLSLEILVRPDEDTLDCVVTWIERGLSGEPLTVISPICPDYKAHNVGGNVYRYTFDGVGDGIGVVGKRLIMTLPKVQKIFSELGLNVRYMVALGDFEGFSAETRDRVGLDEAELRKRFRRSQEQFQAAFPGPVETPLFTDFVGGKEGWNPIYGAIHDGFRRGEYGLTGLCESDLKTIAQARRGLYKSWYRTDDDNDFLDILTAQGAEYSTMGEIISDKFQNPLVLGADHSRMAPFFGYAERLPVLYMKQNYLGVK